MLVQCEWILAASFLILFEYIEVTAERDEVTFELSCDLLPLASCAVAIAGAVVTMPILIAYDIIEALIKVRLEAEGAEFAFAFVINYLAMGRFACAWRRCTRITLIQLFVKIRINRFQICRKLRLVVRIKRIWVDIEVLQP